MTDIEDKKAAALHDLDKLVIDIEKAVSVDSINVEVVIFYANHKETIRALLQPTLTPYVFGTEGHVEPSPIGKENASCGNTNMEDGAIREDAVMLDGCELENSPSSTTPMDEVGEAVDIIERWMLGEYKHSVYGEIDILIKAAQESVELQKHIDKLEMVDDDLRAEIERLKSRLVNESLEGGSTEYLLNKKIDELQKQLEDK